MKNFEIALKRCARVKKYTESKLGCLGRTTCLTWVAMNCLASLPSSCLLLCPNASLPLGSNFTL